MAPSLKRNQDRNLVLALAAFILVAILLFATFGPRGNTNDPQPTTYNTGTLGIKAAYLLLPQLGYGADRWNSPAADLTHIDAARTTLILTAPILPNKDLEVVQRGLKDFLARGGRVIATGPTGATLLPGGLSANPTRVLQGLCLTQNEGLSPLGASGQVQLADNARWDAKGPQYRVAQRCGPDAVVVQYSVGAGTAIWWASALPMTNMGLAKDPDLALLLASVGTTGTSHGTRTVLFDEYLHTEHENATASLEGLPKWSIVWQCVALAVLLILSFGRRNGPLREPAVLTRTSPLEFAESMGHLYQKAGATGAATDAALHALTNYLREECGIPRQVLAGDPAGIADALRSRFGGDWQTLEAHIDQARQASTGVSAAISAKSALKLVQALQADRQQVQTTVSTGNVPGGGAA